MWQPISESELEEIMESELEDCSTEQKTLFTQYRVSPYKVPIHRFGVIEEVFIVAKLPDGLLIYYEDVEEGFELDRLGIDGALENGRFSQFELRHLLENLKEYQP